MAVLVFELMASFLLGSITLVTPPIALQNFINIAKNSKSVLSSGSLLPQLKLLKFLAWFIAAIF
jgi:hypothetical protein